MDQDLGNRRASTRRIAGTAIFPGFPAQVPLASLPGGNVTTRHVAKSQRERG
jgi:hypothetical protein